MPKRSCANRLARVSVLVFVLFLCLPLACAAQAHSGEGTGGGTMCETCHATPGLEVSHASGEVRSAYIDPAIYAESVHGAQLQCTACHQDKQTWPHLASGALGKPARDTGTLIRSYAVCGGCHPDEYQTYLGSSHARALAEGDADAAVCSDCHGAHDVQPADSDVTGLALTPAVYSCGNANCHEGEFAEYRESVHGRSLLTKGDVNTPACVDCHGAHNTSEATSAEFRRQSPYLCATCHADGEMMSQYQVSTAVFNTYVADFHGASVQLFGMTAGDAPEQAACHDCHGTHDIRKSVDPGSQVISQNIKSTCEQCHAGANERFPAAWLGHSEPSPTEAPLVYWIKQIYVVLIVVSVGGLIIHILLDLLRFTRDHMRGGKRIHG